MRPVSSVVCAFMVILIACVFIWTGCSKAELATFPYRYVPPEYLSAIEVTSFDLVYAYQRPQTRAAAEEFYNGKAVIIKNIRITEEIMNDSTKGYLNLGYSLFMKPIDLSALNRISVGDKVDVVGICRGIPAGEYAVILDSCIIEPSGVLSLPLENVGGPIGDLY